MASEFWTFSDNQDGGSIRANLGGLEAQVDSILTTSDSSSYVFHIGDLTDQHDTSGSIHYDQDDAEAERQAYHSYDDSTKILVQQGIDLSEMDEQTRRAYYLQTLGQTYTFDAFNRIKKITDAGRNLYGVCGNQEPHVLTGNQVTPENLEQITEQYRQIAEQQTGAKFIDRIEINKIGGATVFSVPYWAVQRGENHVENQLYDSPDIENSPVYQKLQEVDDAEELIMMLHGRPMQGQDLGMNKVLAKRTGRTIIYHGHEGKPGITYEKNAVGGEIFYVNSNNDVRNKTLTHYKTDLDNDGKVVSFTEYVTTYKEAYEYEMAA
jgi:hypothetical protein